MGSLPSRHFVDQVDQCKGSNGFAHDKKCTYLFKHLVIPEILNHVHTLSRIPPLQHKEEVVLHRCDDT